MASSSSPSPPVAFKDHCSILHNNILYVYQPDAFQTLELTEGAQWKQETSGVSVTGAVCVKGGIDGDSSKPALYVVGGTTNSSNSNFTGLQRYSIADKKWSTITPLSSVTAQRVYHGATYLNASSALLIYGGSQNGNSAPSTETFLMLMYPPYRIQSYPSTAPPVVNPILLPWSDSEAIMVGGSATNQKIFKFHPDPGWVDLGLALPAPLPDKSIAQSSLVTLDDNSKILLTYDMSQAPNVVRRNVVLNAGGIPAAYDQKIGEPTSTAPSPTATSSRILKRAVYLNNYPAYNSSSALNTTRTNFALALGQNDLTAIVGGDNNSTTEFYNQLGNTWQPASNFVGNQQQPLVSSSTSLPSSTSTSPPLSSATSSPSSTPAAVPQTTSGNGLTILGAVLGGICGLAALLIILLLYLRQVRRNRRPAAAAKGNHQSEDKPSLEEQGLQPLSRQAQPMGRSPVPSAILDNRDSVAMFGPRSEKGAVDATPMAPTAPSKHQLGIHNNGSALGFGFKRDKSPLAISKPMMPDLGDYQVRPSIELGKATPIAPTIVLDTGLVTALPDPVENAKLDQRRTDEGWAKYFSAEKESEKRDTTLTAATNVTQMSAPSRSGRGGFWPGSGVPETSRASNAKNPLRDSEGRSLTAHKVVAGSPNLTVGASDMRTQTMSTAEGMEAKISSGDSVSTDATEEDDDDYEDDQMTVYSSGVPESVHDNTWTPVGAKTWSGAQQLSARPPSAQIGSADFALPTSTSNTTSNTDSTKSSLPNFPMPGTTVRRTQPTGTMQAGLSFMPPAARTSTASSIYGPPRIASEDYFNRSIHLATTVTPQPEAPHHQHNASQQSQPTTASVDPNDMSWINLGTPAANTPPMPPPQHQPMLHPANP